MSEHKQNLPQSPTKLERTQKNLKNETKIELNGQARQKYLENMNSWLQNIANLKPSINNQPGYTINNDLTIDVKGTIDLTGKDIRYLPYKFNKITNDFLISGCNLESLNNSPNEVGGKFQCCNNHLTSLEGIENMKVKGNFEYIFYPAWSLPAILVNDHIDGNPGIFTSQDITNTGCQVEGIVRGYSLQQKQKQKDKIKNWIDSVLRVWSYIINEDLTIDITGDVNLENVNIKYFPYKFNRIRGNFYANNCNLKSLKNTPYNVEGDFCVNGNFLIDFEYSPKFVWDYQCLNNQIKSLKGLEDVFILYDFIYVKSRDSTANPGIFTEDDIRKTGANIQEKVYAYSKQEKQATLHPEDVVALIGEEAYFTILNLNLEPNETIRWQYRPANSLESDPWIDLNDQNGHHKGTHTGQLVVTSSFTQLNNNGDEYRAVFSDKKTKTAPILSNSSILHLENIAAEDIVEVNLPSFNFDSTTSVTVNAGQSIKLNPTTFPAFVENGSFSIEYKFGELSEWLTIQNLIRLDAGENSSYSSSNAFGQIIFKNAGPHLVSVSGVINTGRPMSLKINAFNVANNTASHNISYALKIDVLGIEEAYLKTRFGSWGEGTDPEKMNYNTYSEITLHVGNKIWLDGSITAGTDQIKIEYKYDLYQKWLPLENSSLSIIDGKIDFVTRGSIGYYYTELIDTFITPPRTMFLKLSSKYYNHYCTHVLIIHVSGIFAITENLPDITELPNGTSEAVMAVNFTEGYEASIQWQVKPSLGDWTIITDGTIPSNLSSLSLTYAGATEKELKISRIGPQHENFSFKAIVTKIPRPKKIDNKALLSPVISVSKSTTLKFFSLPERAIIPIGMKIVNGYPSPADILPTAGFTNDLNYTSFNPYKPDSIPSHRMIVGGTDDREIVTNYNDFPYSCIFYMRMYKKNSPGFGNGTGFLISKDTILTWGHNIYDCEKKEYRGNFEFSSASPSAIITAKVIGVWVDEEYIATGNTRHDWALLKLDKPIGNNLGWLGAQWISGINAYEGSKATVTGYGQKTLPMYTHTDSIISSQIPEFLYYLVDTVEGTSGAPIYRKRTNRVIGIHTMSVSPRSCNAGIRITKTLFNIICRVRNFVIP